MSRSVLNLANSIPYKKFPDSTHFLETEESGEKGEKWKK
jgi:hypothetical protein